MAKLLGSSYQELIKLHAKKSSRKIGNNTYSFLRDDGTIDVKYHNTIIVTLYRNGGIRFTMGGYGTVTTRDRINNFIRSVGFDVYQRNHQQRIWNHNTKAMESLPIDPYAVYGIMDGKLNELV